MKIRISVLVIVFAAILIYFFLPKHKCGSECEEETLSKLNVLAESGDLSAIEQLLEKSRSDGVEVMVDHWLLQGALQGDQKKCAEYVARYGSFDKERQTRILEIVRGSSESPGKKCLLVGILK